MKKLNLLFVFLLTLVGTSQADTKLIKQNIIEFYVKSKSGVDFFEKLEKYSKCDDDIARYMKINNLLLTENESRRLKEKSWNLDFHSSYSDKYDPIKEGETFPEGTELTNKTHYPFFKWNTVTCYDALVMITATGKIKLLEILYETDEDILKFIHPKIKTSILYFAIVFEQIDTIKYLTDPKQIDKDSIVTMATVKDKNINQTILHLLAKQDKHYSPILRKLLKYEKVRKIVNEKINEKHKAREDETALKIAQDNNCKKNIVLLLNNGATENNA